jgi:hypothetical protein
VNREVGRVESKIRMEYSHEHIPPFVDSTYSEATDIAIESNYTVESALSDNDAHVNSLLFPMPPGGLESSALNTSNASSRNLSAHIHSIALDVDRAVVRLDEDAQEPGWKVRDSAADSREEDKGENLAVFSGSPPGSPRRPEAEAQNPNSAEGADPPASNLHHMTESCLLQRHLWNPVWLLLNVQQQAPCVRMILRRPSSTMKFAWIGNRSSYLSTIVRALSV